MTVQLINILQRPDTMRTNKALICKRTQSPEDLRVCIQHDLVLPRRPGALPIICLHRVRRRAGIDPLLNFDLTGAIVDFVCDVCGLRADVAHLTYEDDAGSVGAVDLVVGFWVGLGGIEGLFDCDGTKGGVVEVALSNVSLLLRRYSSITVVPDPG